MKLYFLVEGESSEMDVYPGWIKYLIPQLDYHNDFNGFKTCENGFFLISGMGYPSIYNHIENAVKDVNEIGDVDYFFIVIDSDEDVVSKRKLEIEERLSGFSLGRTIVISVVQNRCLETLLLGNKKKIPRQPTTFPLIDYLRYYNVNDNDPELMGKETENTHSQFHYKYLKTALRERRIPYSKSNASALANGNYLKPILDRIYNDHHLCSFKEMFDILLKISEI